MPANTPRKKVQFLVECRKEEREEREESSRPEKPTSVYEDVFEGEEVKKQEQNVDESGVETPESSSEDGKSNELKKEINKFSRLSIVNVV